MLPLHVTPIEGSSREIQTKDTFGVRRDPLTLSKNYSPNKK